MLLPEKRVPYPNLFNEIYYESDFESTFLRRAKFGKKIVLSGLN